MKRIGHFLTLVCMMMLVVMGIPATALSAATDRRGKNKGKLQQFGVNGGSTIYEGALVGLNEEGYLVPVTDAANISFQGVAYETKKNTTAEGYGTDNDLKCRVYRSGVFRIPSANGLVQSDVGILVHAMDDNNIEPDDQSSHDIVAGVLLELDTASFGWVDIDPGVAVGALST